jgi:hypothetical protein
MQMQARDFFKEYDELSAAQLMTLFNTNKELERNVTQYVNSLLLPYSYGTYELSPYCPTGHKYNEKKQIPASENAKRVLELSITFKHLSSTEVILNVHPETYSQALMKNDPFLNFLWTSSSLVTAQNLKLAFPEAVSTIRQRKDSRNTPKLKYPTQSFFEEKKTTNEDDFVIAEYLEKLIAICCTAQPDCSESSVEIMKASKILANAAKWDIEFFNYIVVYISDEASFKDLIFSILKNDDEGMLDESEIRIARKNYFWYLISFTESRPDCSYFSIKSLESIVDSMHLLAMREVETGVCQQHQFNMVALASRFCNLALDLVVNMDADNFMKENTLKRVNSCIDYLNLYKKAALIDEMQNANSGSVLSLKK